MAIVAVLIVIIVVGVGAYALLGTSSSSNTSSSSSSSESMTSSSTASTSATSTASTFASSVILNGATSGAFFNSQVVSFGYTQNVDCTPALSTYATNQSEATLAAAKTACEVGGGNSTAVSGAAPVFILVPAYAGLSIFGVPALGATAQGFPVYNNSPIFTQCGAGGTVSACFDHPTYVYSTVFTSVEQHIGITGGYGGLPEGVLPTPSHDHVVGYTGGPSIPWDVIAVLVFDPNIMPNGETGQCTAVVASNLANPTANCLTSFTAIANALTTQSSASANANSTQNNPIFDTLGGVTTQVAIPGVTAVSESSPANTNLFLYFSASSSNPYP